MASYKSRLFLFPNIHFGLLVFSLQSFFLITNAWGESHWHMAYKEIVSPSAIAFMSEGFDYAQRLLGLPAIDVRKINLRLSEPINPARRIRRDFALTETTDSQLGTFTIYTSAQPGEYPFYGQLAHEVGHLLNANLHDAYAEGICTVFAEFYLTSKDLDWYGWLNYFKTGKAPFYSATYFMVREMWEIVGNHEIGRLLGFAVPFSDGTSKMFLDTGSWLATLPKQKQDKVTEVITKYYDEVQSSIKTTGKKVAFKVPGKCLT